MRLALIADIHGNDVSLQTVLANIESAGIDDIVCLGDVAATGPQPHEVATRLRSLGVPVVQGNTDSWLLDPETEDDVDGTARKIQDIDLWCAAELNEVDRNYLRSFVATLDVEMCAGVNILCFHGSVSSNRDVILSTTPDDDLDRLISGYNATVFAGGHTHVQMVRRYDHSMIVNPGSVGLPFVRNQATGRVTNPPWAEYAVVSCDAGHLHIDLRRVSVDVMAIARVAQNSGMPHGTWWAEDWMR